MVALGTAFQKGQCPDALLLSTPDLNVSCLPPVVWSFNLTLLSLQIEIMC